MKLKRLFSLFIGFFLMMELLFIAGSAWLLVWQENRTARESTIRDFDRIYQGNATEIVGNLMLGHLQLIVEQMRQLSGRENISIDLVNGANTYREGGIPSNGGVTKEFPVMYAGKHYGTVRFFRPMPKYWERQWGILAIFVLVQCLLFGFINYLPYRWSQKAIIEPLEELVTRARRGEIEGELTSYRLVPTEVSTISTILSKLWVENEEKSREAAIGQISAQVAHDIRSPLMALKIAAEDLSALPEAHRELFRGAITRIHDIATSLLKLRQGHGEPNPEQLVVLVHDLVQEKKLQYSVGSDLEIKAFLTSESYPLFATVDRIGLQRVLSNLINNAAEARGTSQVLVSLEPAAMNRVKLTVQDDGDGIPAEILPQLMSKEITYGKKGGTGLGLFSARQMLESWGGSLQIDSRQGKGTTVTALLPRVPPPAWFVPSLPLKGTKPIVTVDDDTHIHFLWKSRLKDKNALHCFGDTESFRDWLSKQNGLRDEALFLIDMEYVGGKENGLQLIESLHLTSQAVLVTHRHDDDSVRERCQKLGLRLLPKSAAELIPLTT